MEPIKNKIACKCPVNASEVQRDCLRLIELLARRIVVTLQSRAPKSPPKRSK